jgi:hydrogenase maturation protein HypF
MTVGRRFEIRGTVQGVGFRPWVYRLAVAHHVVGRVRNDASGVVIEVFGSSAAVDRFANRLLHDPPPAADIRETRSSAIAVEPLSHFAIVSSADKAAPQVSIPADLSTCDDCLADIRDATNRRSGYPFTTCTKCGPRFTIAEGIPYDRERTTMRAFPLCVQCGAEYEQSADRRFHAEATACPACGPRLSLVNGDGTLVAAPDSLDAVVEAITSGAIVAIKGLGGIHLGCDATSVDAVARLRRRKRRDEKPFAVMVASVADAAKIIRISPAERRVLTGVERPIVLGRRRSPSAVADNVAPGVGLLGVMLPYTPLHHLLLARAGRPLVMTSGNLSDEPLAFRNDEAVSRLGSIADLFLLHDREIAAPCDDSVVTVIAGAPVILRRSRGYVPVPIAISPAFAVPVLACGALLKNTFCIGVGRNAYFGPHIGDLSNDAAHQRYVESIERMLRFLRVTPEIIGHDLHPDYPSTHYARARCAPMTIGVQHHHAHVVSAMAEHGLTGPVIGVAYDGTGYGPDGTSWGGEVMVADRASFDRIATLRPLRLPGGDQAIRQPWRVALALVDDAFDGEPPLDDLRLFAGVPRQHLEVVRRMMAKGVNTPVAHGAGRYFDAIAALALARPASAYEGQLALQWNTLADEHETRCYGFSVDRCTSPWTIDLRPMVRDVVRELIAGSDGAAISARFHNTLAAATDTAVRRAARERGALPVVLTGGCFQNARLAEGVLTRLGSQFSVHLHRRVPPGDGGVALGQAVVAAAMAKTPVGQ